MDHTATITEVCAQISNIKKVMRAHGAVAYRNDGDWNNAENVDWTSLFLIAQRDHETIDIPGIREIAQLDARLRGVEGGVAGIIGNALQLAATGKVMEAGEAIEAFASVMLEAFSAHLAQNLINNRARYGTQANVSPISSGACSFHPHGVSVVDQSTPAALVLRQAV